MNTGERQRMFPTSMSTTAFVKLYTLHLLQNRDYYGNRLKDEIKRRLKGKWSPSYGMMYPMLRQLEEEGYIEGWWEEPTKRSIRRYKITDAGIEHYKVIKMQNKEALDDSLSIIKNVLKDIYNEQI